jgi:hypothetical protein
VDLGQSSRAAGAKYLVLFYRPGCPNCERQLDLLLDAAVADQSGNEPLLGLVIVSDEPPPIAIPNCEIFNIRDRDFPYVTPLVIELENGSISTVADHLPRHESRKTEFH